MKVKIVTSYRVSHLQRCGVTERVNVTSVYRPLSVSLRNLWHVKDPEGVRGSRLSSAKFVFVRFTPD
jgi:hypothetical protein